MSERVKLCRGCGFKPDINAVADSNQRVYGYIVRCCGFKTEMMSRRKDAVAAWNARPESGNHEQRNG